MLNLKQLFAFISCFISNCYILTSPGYSKDSDAAEFQPFDQAGDQGEERSESDKNFDFDRSLSSEYPSESDVFDKHATAPEPTAIPEPMSVSVPMLEHEASREFESIPETEGTLGPEVVIEPVAEPTLEPEVLIEPEQKTEHQDKPGLQQKQTTMPEEPKNSETASPEARSEVSPELLNAAPDIMDIIKRGELRVGICPVDQPPFHVKKENGEIFGFDVDLANGISESLKVTLKLIEAPDWEQTITYLLDGKVDLVISNLTATPERASKIFCSVPYAKIRQCVLLNRVLVARAAGKNITTLRDIFSIFENHTLLAQEGTSYVSLAKSLFPSAEVLSTLLWKDIIARILSKEAMGTISDELEIKEQLKSVKTVELLPIILKKKYDRIVIGVSRSAPQLLHFVNNYIETNNVECNLEDF
ncbi:MAG: transporter substrate-binding domain-containing protein [Holosporales bacterium]|jgi:ABC-type amino acid transport substrate-binding protein|nr:transporter substrate-binding domain-containing protein [Holosporales bacterium]